MLSFLCLRDVVTSWRDVMMSKNSLLLYQLVDVLKWWYTCIYVIISIALFQVNIVYVLAWCLHVITWRHDVTKITTWRQETNCLHPSLQMCSIADFISFLWFLWWLNSTWLLSSHLHDGITSRNDVMTSLHMLYLSQLVDVLVRWLFFLFCFYSMTSSKISLILYFHMWSCHKVTLWRHGMTIWRNITHSIHLSVWRDDSLPVYTWFFGSLNQEMS